MLFNFVGMWFEHYAMLSNYVGTWWQLLSFKPSNWSIVVAKLVDLNIFIWMDHKQFCEQIMSEWTDRGWLWQVIWSIHYLTMQWVYWRLLMLNELIWAMRYLTMQPLLYAFLFQDGQQQQQDQHWRWEAWRYQWLPQGQTPEAWPVVWVSLSMRPSSNWNWNSEPAISVVVSMDPGEGDRQSYSN